ncbi:hypothetical protein BDZ97DRAFT_1907539 [Flammula alnicola]|nr:hypothetical protein BDZ97DRAFT_1907539 [Flammula alnicola]
MKLINDTQSLHLDVEPISAPFHCSCGGESKRTLNLFSHGVFPCTPLVPTLAVDICVLEFVSRLFLNIAPNTTVWCKTVEGFLESQGYWLSMKHINNILYHTRRLGTEYNDGCHASTPLNAHSTSATSAADDVSDVEDTPRAQAQPNTSSTPNTHDYLRSHCPLCFGGKFPRPSESKDPDIIVCMHACFKQKCNAGDKDPPREHPETVFILETSTWYMEEYIETDATTSAQEPEDGFDGQIFYAADEHRQKASTQKASTQFFSETALMALLCHHDHVLWIVSMNSAGEKQYYTLMLLEMLFQNIPSTFIVGLLYDIGCQLHQSCIKWGFLDRYLPHLMCAISCIGFGLSDGEGCERLWKSLQILIPYLRVCGHYQRLYTLNRQILHAERESLHHFGHWLLRHTRHCGTKPCKSINFVSIFTCTNELPGQSKHKGKDAVEKAMRLQKARDILKGQVHELENVISDGLSEDYTIAEVELRLPEVRERFEKAAAQVKAVENGLGVDEHAKLKQLANNPFISAQMNARALKIHLRERLRSQKFELDRLERSFQHQVNKSSVKQCDLSIQKLSCDYNKLCKVMSNLKAQHKAPHGAVCPEEIDMSGLFALNVDDDIWQDIGLDDTLDDPHASVAPPLWLSDDNDGLAWEQSSLQFWFAEEWDVVSMAYNAMDAGELPYQLQLCKDELLSLLVGWHKTLQSVVPGTGDLLPEWGPTEDEIMNARDEVIEIDSALIDT